jgi:hypothetical protein
VNPADPRRSDRQLIGFSADACRRRRARSDVADLELAEVEDGALDPETGRLMKCSPESSALSAVVFLLAQGLTLLFIGRVLSGLAAGTFTGTATAMLVDLAGEDKGQRAAQVATAANMGGLGLGSLLAGLLAQFAPVRCRCPTGWIWDWSCWPS